MSETELYQHVAEATGESLRTIRRLGFSTLGSGEADHPSDVQALQEVSPDEHSPAST